MTAFAALRTNTAASQWLRLVLAVLTVCAVLSALVLAYDGKRLFQVLVLALPVGLSLCWPHRHTGWRALHAVIVGLLGFAFIADAAVRCFLQEVYGASPASAMVLAAVANTTPQEVTEFMAMYGHHVWPWALWVFMSWVLLVTSLLGWWFQPWPRPKVHGWRLGVVCVLLALVVLSLVSKPWRHHHPLVFWTGWMADVSKLRAQWADFGVQRQRLVAHAHQHRPALSPAGPDTLVLVIGESINREHLSLYGYPRDTTPQLVRRHQSENPRLGVFRHAWSVDASTIAALRHFFYMGQTHNTQPHLLALAKAAGYRTWWVSNHDDLAIEQEHAQLADSVHMLNKIPGRSGRSMDERTLPVLEAALKDPTPRKLIVLHLLGAHPHYQLRHPHETGPFHNVQDEIDQSLKAKGRSSRVRGLRNDYDSAVHYHDTVVAATLDLTRQHGQKAAWVYFSDHGQEVGHAGEHVGHSAVTADGYRVPVLLWGDAIEALSTSSFLQPVRTDWLGYTVLRLLGIDWWGHVPQHDVLDPRYQWQPPALDMVADFKS